MKLVAEAAIVIVALIAMAGVLTVRRARRHEAAARSKYPPEGQFVLVDGVKMHAVSAGSGPDVVLIHGSSGSTRDFTFGLMPELAKRYRVIAIDRPGMGWSAESPKGEGLGVQAQLLQKTAASLGASKPIVLGQSYGGAVGLAWALDYPDTIAALVPVSAPSHPWTTGLGAYYSLLSHPVGQAVAVPLLTAFAPDATVKKEVEAVFSPQPAPKGYARHFAARLSLRRAAMRVNARMRKALHREIADMYPRYGDITVPVEIVHGTADALVSHELHSERLADDVASANLTLLQGIGHMPHQVAMDAVVAAVDRAAARAGLRDGSK